MIIMKYSGRYMTNTPIRFTASHIFTPAVLRKVRTSCRRFSLKDYTMHRHFTNETHEKAWLIRVTANKCKDYLKSSRYSNMSLNEEIISDKSYEDDKAMDIQAKIISLDDKYKTVIYLFYYEDYSVKQIASCLRLTESTVKMRLKRAREILKKELKDYEEF